MNGRTLFRIFLAVIVVAAVAVLGFWVYNLGIAQGLAQSGQLADGVRPGPGMMPWMFGAPMFWGFRPFGYGFGFLGCLVPLLFFFLVLALFRGLFWGPWGRGGWRGGWGQGHVPPMFEEWHRRAHGEAPQPGGGSQEPPAGQ